MVRYYKPFLFIILLWSCCLVPGRAQSPVVLGKATEVAALFKEKANAKTTNAIGGTKTNVISHNLPGQIPLELNLNVSRKEGLADVYSGNVNNLKNSNFFLKVTGNDLSGLILLRDQHKAFQYSSGANGLAYLEEVNIDEVVCAEYQAGPVASNAASDQPTIAAAVPDLQSLPGAEAVVLLDFDGQYVNSPYWNNGNPINAAPANLTATEMVEVWKLISEDYKPFMINITTSEAVYQKAPANRRLRAIFTPTNTAAPGSGGVAYISFFTRGNETPCWIFNSGIKGAGDAGSHEIGHTLGLQHDGRTSPSESYFLGQSSWAPIMGAGYSKTMVQWSKGEYPAANNTEDD
ncbi:MAG: hypothetical protein M3Q05_14735, partial [Bacteroidota bacterium]|nr:hypothetical protein [Bacteroidota bacterium]